MRNGARGEDLILEVPAGTVVTVVGLGPVEVSPILVVAPAAAGLAAVCRRCRWVAASGSAVNQKRLLGIVGARAA